MDLSIRILLVIPVYNHADTVRTVVEKALACGWPVLVIDDGSSDDIAGQLTALTCEYHALDKNCGKGAAILAAAQIAREQGYEAIITVDADGQLDPSDGQYLAEKAMEKWPALVIGSRRMDSESAPAASLFGRAFSNFWVRLECGLELPDTQSGLRLYPVAELLSLKIRCRRYDFEIESLVRLAWSGVAVRSVPVSVHYPEPEERQSHFHQFKDNFRLTMLHTRLVCRALCPWPHSKLVELSPEEKLQKRQDTLSLLHPVKLIRRLCLEHTSTLQLAVAVWMGIFLGALPLIACHTVAILYVTHRLHLNKPAAVSASQFCMPPVVPVICMQAGYFMRKGHFLLDINWDTMVLQIDQRLWEWLIGSLVVGPLLGLIGAALVYFSVRRLRAVDFGACDPLEDS